MKTTLSFTIGLWLGIFFITHFSGVLNQNALGQAGSIDPSFNPTDVGFGFGDGANGEIHATAIQNDGKVIIGGVFTTYNGTPINRIARLNVDGTLDNSFNVGTGTNGSYSFICCYSGTVYSVAIQSDGKILVAGDFVGYNGNAANRIVRLNTNGSMDASFNSGTAANNYINDVKVRADGKILIAGAFTSFNGTGRNRIARLNSDGTLDVIFDPGTGADGTIQKIALQGDGKILISGSAFTQYNGTNRNRIARLNSDGSLDIGFNPGSGLPGGGIVFEFIVQDNGKILIGGVFNSYNGTARNNLALIASDGTLENVNPVGVSGEIRAMVQQQDKKIVLAGAFNGYSSGPGIWINDPSLGASCGYNKYLKIMRIDSSYVPDLTYGSYPGVPGTISADATIRSLALQNDGQIIVAGDFATFNRISQRNIVRLHSNGDIDLGYNRGTGANAQSTPFSSLTGSIRTIYHQADGKILIGGVFNKFNGTLRRGIARLQQNGIIDSTFEPGIIGPTDGAFYSGAVHTITQQTDGKIIVGGTFTNFNGRYSGSNSSHLVRLNLNGSIDSSFTTPMFWSCGGPVNTVRKILVQNDGKIIVGGDFQVEVPGNSSTKRLLRLNSDGTTDQSFNQGSGPNGDVYTMLLQPDGRIIIGGDFEYYNNISVNRIARLNTDGTFDTSFHQGTGVNAPIYSMALQSDGKITIGGSFRLYNNEWKEHIARINPDGTLDNTFYSGALSFYRINAVALQNDGKILIGGAFPLYGGVARNKFARLNPNGSLDTTFQVGTGANGDVYAISLLNNSLLIGGDFTSYNGTGRNRLAQIVSGVCVPPTITSNPSNATRCTGEQVTFSVSATGTGLTYQWRKNASNISGATSNSYTIASVSTSDAGDYDVVVSGTCSPTVTSTTATLAVNTQPSITSQPSSNDPVCPGTSVSFSTAALGNPIPSIQWQSSSDNGVTYGDIAGENSNTLTIVNPPLSMNGNKYRAVFTNSCSSVTTNEVTLHVEDNTAPVPDVATLLTVTGECSASVTAPTATDNCVGQVIGTTTDPLTYNTQGTYTVTWTYSDGNGNTSAQTQTVVVDDNTGPSITCPSAITQVTDAGVCSAVVTFAANATDNCSTPTVICSPASGSTFNKGTTVVTCTATDEANNSSTCSFTITVVDNQDPDITLKSSFSLWPPNHDYVTVPLADMIASVSDNCGGVSIVDVNITKGTSDEPEDANGNGDGNTLNDIVIASDCKSVQVRRERDGNGNGRVYTIHLKLTDDANNVTTKTFKITVPHDQNGSSVDDGEVYVVTGNCGTPKQQISDREIPTGIVLDQNFPNPFGGATIAVNPSTTIRFSLVEESPVVLKVFNVLGLEVATLVNETKNAGTHSVTFNATNLESGLYTYTLKVAGQTLSRKMLLLK